MKILSQRNIIGSIAPSELIDRESELERLYSFAFSGQASGLSVLAAPGTGSSELLRQTFDRIFYSQEDVIPFYFALRSTDAGPREAALRFVQDLLTQTVAFRRRDPSIIWSSPEIHELAELALPSDGYWIDRLVEAYYADPVMTGDRSAVRSLLSGPMRAAAHGARFFVMIDDVHRAATMTSGMSFFDEIRDVYSHSAQPYVLAGARRFLFGAGPADTIRIDTLGFAAAGRLVESIAAKNGVTINDQTRDLIAVQLDGNSASISSFIVSAGERGEKLDDFRSVERCYTDEIFGGRLSCSLDTLIDTLVPADVRPDVIRLLSEGIGAESGKMPLSYWRRQLALTGSEFRSMIGHLNVSELVSFRSGSVFAELANHVLTDYIRGRARLEAGDTRALVVGKSATSYLKRAPQLLARVYRRNSTIGLRDLLGAFDCQEIPVAAIDYAGFKAELKGLNDTEIGNALANSTDRIKLPQIVYTAHTAAFYSKIGELIEDERSTIALGFEESNYRDETVWIAAEIDSKLEAARDLTEFWLDRLEMVAVSCNFPNYRMWLVAPEGFSDGAAEALRTRGAYGSCRKQAELLIRELIGKGDAGVSGNGDAYEIVIPMGDDTEMIAAHAVEEIAKRHNFPPKAINQIKTALVEACINATEHSLSPDRRIYQKFLVDDEKITITVSNRGLRLADKSVKEIVPDEGRRGWGLKLMKGLMDEVRIEQSDDGTSITMIKNRSATSNAAQSRT